ncbi:MAG: tyrosine-type recombinase/integrase [Saprospiraceae bacterium]
MIIQQFIKYLTFEKRYSSHTILAYENDLSEFKSYLNERYEIEDLKIAESEHIRSWIVSLMRANKTNTTINRKIASLKSFYKYLQIHFDSNQNPTNGVVIPKNKKRLPQFVKPNEIIDLLASFNDAEDYISLRDKMIIELLYVTGIRRSELMDLKLDNLNFQQGYIKVMGKRQKERIIPISKQLSDDLKYYWTIRNNNFETDNNHLFLTQKGKSLYPKAIYNIVKTYLKGFTTIEQKSPHTLRHSFATHLLNNGAELNAIKELLGHESLAATQIYTHTTLNKLKSAYLKAHPKASN